MTKVIPFLRRHLGALIAGATTAVVLVGGLLILTAAGGQTTPTPPSTASGAPSGTTTTLAPPAAGPSAGAGAAAGRLGVRGQITAINGDTWTVTSARGTTVVVAVTPATAFGTKARPMTAKDFAVGDQIVVQGARSKGTVTATRIAKAPAGRATAPTTAVSG